MSSSAVRAINKTSVCSRLMAGASVLLDIVWRATWYRHGCAQGKHFDCGDEGCRKDRVSRNRPQIPDGQPLTQSGKADILIIRFMKKTSITVTEASRNFADCVNRAHYQNVTFVLLKNGEP